MGLFVTAHIHTPDAKAAKLKLGAHIMCNWKRWVWPGILATVILTALAMFFHSNTIEQDLTAKAGQALQAEHDWATVSLDGRDLTLSGTAPSPEAQAAAALVADGAYDVRVVNNATQLLDLAEPYQFKATKDEQGVTLTGNVPSDIIRSEIVAAAQTSLPGIEVTDEMTLARGAPNDYTALAGFGLSQLGNLQTGEVSLSDTSYTVSGVAADVQAYETELARATNDLPAAGTLALADITPPAVDGPYVWSATKAADGAITLEGFAPSLEARSAIEAQAASANEGATITNNLKIATGAPAGFEQLTAFGLGQLTGLSTGVASVSDLAYSINGTAIDSASFDAVFEAANGVLPGDATLANATIIPPARDGSYTWVASKSSDNQITLNGFAPSVEARAAIEAEAVRANPGATIVNALQVAAGAPEGFVPLTTFGLSQLNGLESGSVSTSDLDYSISGIAADSASFDAVTNAANGDLPAGASLANASIIPPALDGNYTWSATKSAGNEIVLEGFAPSAQARADIAAQAASANDGATIVNNLQVASGAPDGFDALTAFGLGQLPSLATGKVSTSNLDYAIEGTAIDSVAFDEATAVANGTLPAGAALASADIAPPAADGGYVWGAQKAVDGTVTLTGLMPNTAARDRIAARAAEVNPGATIDNQIRIASGAPEGFVDAADFSLGYLPNFSAGSASLSGLDMSVEGQALDLNAFDAAGALGASAPNGYTLQANVSLPPASGAYELVATKTDDVLVLNGVAPSEEAKATIIQAAEALDGINVVDRISLASGAPDGIDWGQSGAFAVTGLEGIRNGTAALRAQALSIDGEATDGDSFAAANAVWDGDLPAGTSLASKAIRLPQISPYEWTAERGDTVTISGYVPSRDVGDAIAATAADLFGPSIAVTDNQQLAGGAPVGFDAASSVGLNAINRLQDARAEIRDNTLRVTGVAATEAAKEAIERNVENGIPPGFTSVAELTVLPLPSATDTATPVTLDQCQAQLNNLLQEGQIRFETNEAIINEASFGLLDQLAYTAQTCPDARIEVGGHTDSDGSAEYNQRLSDSRATAVVNYLTAAGVSADRLDARGFGEDQPIADNTTQEGKAQNRRIEFKVIQ